MATLGSLSLRYVSLRIGHLIWRLLGKPGSAISPPRIWALRNRKNKPDTRPKTFSWRKRQKVIARSRCWYRCFDLSALPARKRQDALLLQLNQWIPVKAPVHDWIVWEKGVAMVWVWAKEHEPAGKGYCVPEPVLFPPAKGKLRYLQLREGYELQYWDRSGALRRSQWSLSPFTPLALQSFLLTPGQKSLALPAIDIKLLTPRPLTPHAYPWRWPFIPRADKVMLTSYSLTGALLFATLSISSWVGADILRLTHINDQWQNRRAQLEEQLGPQIQLRQEALNNRQYAEALIKQLPTDQQTRLIARFIRALQNAPDAKAPKIERWSFYNGRLDAEVANIKQVKHPDLVAAMQTEGGFFNIRVDNMRNSDKLRISATLNANETADDLTQTSDNQPGAIIN